MSSPPNSPSAVSNSPANTSDNSSTMPGVQTMNVCFFNLGISLILSLGTSVYICCHSLLKFSSSESEETFIPVLDQKMYMTVCLAISVSFLFGYSAHHQIVEFAGATFGTAPITYPITMAIYFRFPTGVFYIEIAILAFFSLFGFFLVSKLSDYSISAPFYHVDTILLLIFLFTNRFIFNFIMKHAILSGDYGIDEDELSELVTMKGESINEILDALRNKSKSENTIKAEKEFEEEELKKLELLTMDEPDPPISASVVTSVLTLTFLLYPMTVIPLYNSGETAVKAVVVLVLHPIITESILMLLRANAAKGLQGRLPNPMKDSITAFLFESFMVLIRRVMLCNLGSSQATVAGTLFNALLITAQRCTVHKRTLWFRDKILKLKPPSEKTKTHIKKVVSCSLFHQMIAEGACIILGPIMHIIYSDHRMTFNLAYSSAFEAVKPGGIVLNIVLAQLAEVGSSLVASSYHIADGIDIFSIMQEIDHSIVILTWGHSLVFACFAVLWVFKATPNILFCSSADDPCTCSKTVYPLFTETCDYAATLTNTTVDTDMGTNSMEASNLVSTSLGEIANMDTIIVGALVVLAMGGIILITMHFIHHQKFEREQELLEQAVKAKELTPEQLSLVAEIMGADVLKEEKLMKSDKLAAYRNAQRRKSVTTTTLQKLEIKSGDINITKRGIGRGAFGDVHLAKWNGVDVAIKQLSSISQESIAEFKFEILLMSQLRHPNICALMGALWNQSMVGIVLEFCENGSMYDILKKGVGEKLYNNWTWRDPMLRIVTEVAMGMQYLHTTTFFDEKRYTNVECVLHRDLKTANVLLTTNYTAKVADFGTSKAITPSAEDLTVTGTPIYMAPEVVQGKRYNSAADVYSFAILMFAIICPKGNVYQTFVKAVKEDREKNGEQGKKKLRVSTTNIMRLVAENNVRPELDIKYESLKNLIVKCWNGKASARPDFNFILKTLETKVKEEVHAAAGEEEDEESRQAKEQLKIDKLVINRARGIVDKLSTPFTLLRASELLKWRNLESHEKILEKESDKKQKALVTFTSASDLDLFLSKHYTIYFSHEWRNQTDPDTPVHTKLKMIKFAIGKLTSTIRTKNVPWDEDEDATARTKRMTTAAEKTFVFIDYCCLPQDDVVRSDLYSANLPLVCSRLHSFVVAVTSMKIPGIEKYKDKNSFFKRGQCQAEVWSHISRRGVDDLYIVSSPDEMKCVRDESADEIEKIYESCSKMFSGTFTCCQERHGPGHTECKKLLLMEPMLGIFIHIYKHRLLPVLKTSYDIIKNDKVNAFPEYTTYDLPGMDSQDKPLFMNKINVAENSVDFENMLEAAGDKPAVARKEMAKYTTHLQKGMQFEFDDSGDDDVELGQHIGTKVGEEELRIIREDMDLKEVLIDPNQFIFETDGNGVRNSVLLRSDGTEFVKGKYNGHPVTVKTLDVDKANKEENLFIFKKTCLFLKELKHDNIVMLIGAIWTDELVCYVMEYCAGESLKALLNTAGTNLTWAKHKFRWMLDICRGMEYLHGSVFVDNVGGTVQYGEGVIHRNLMCENVLLSTSNGLSEMSCKLSEFGEDKVSSANGEIVILGKPFYMAPEVYRGDPYDKKCDVFSFAMCVVEMCQQGGVEKLLADRAKAMDCSENVSSNKLLELVSDDIIRPLITEDCNVCKSIRKLMRDCWQGSAAKRPDFQEIISRLEGEIRAEIKPEETLSEAKDRRKVELNEAWKKAQARLRDRKDKIERMQQKRFKIKKNAGDTNSSESLRITLEEKRKTLEKLEKKLEDTTTSNQRLVAMKDKITNMLAQKKLQ